MGFLKKLFEKKDCEICGGEIGLFGNRKLEDGDCCKNCAAKLSPWFDERRHSTVAQIKAQIAYREENERLLADFNPTTVLGDENRMFVEMENGHPTRFAVSRYADFRGENADLLTFKQVLSCNIDIDEDKNELQYRNDEGEMVDYNPPRYEYNYDFYVELTVDHPYFSEMRFRINEDTVVLEPPRGKMLHVGTGFDPSLHPEWVKYREICNEIERLIQRGKEDPAPVEPPKEEAVPEEAPAPAGPVTCPFCGASDVSGKFCEYCGAALT